MLPNNSTYLTEYKTSYNETQNHNNSFGKPKKCEPYDLYRLCKYRSKIPQVYDMNPIWHTVKHGKCYVHKEGKSFINRPIPISCLPTSRSFPNNSENVLAFLNSCEGIDDKWVSLPAYAIDDGSNKVNDFQCATTGTKSDDEDTFDQTSERECSEENGITVSNAVLIKSSRLDHPNKEVHAYVYYVNQVLPGNTNIKPVPKEKDNSSHKIMSWILFDSPEQIQNRKRINTSSSGDSAGLLTVVMKVSDLKNLIQLCY